jgi:hypothetical protein
MVAVDAGTWGKLSRNAYGKDVWRKIYVTQMQILELITRERREYSYQGQFFKRQATKPEK